MEVLLQTNVENVGSTGDLVKVKAGYANNYLFPRGLAVLANQSNKKELEHNKRLVEAKKNKELTAARELATVIGTLSLTVQKQVGEEDKIFGSVTTKELADAFHAAGYEIDRRAITIDEEIKRVGVYKGHVKLHADVTAPFNIWVIAQQ